MNEHNIFDSPMASFEFTEDIAEKIAADWEEEDTDNANLYQWLANGFKDSIISKVKRRLEK